MARQRRSYTPEYKEQIARMVIEESRAIPSTARDIGVNEQTLRNWVNVYRQAHAGEEPPLSISERARRVARTSYGVHPHLGAGDGPCSVSGSDWRGHHGGRLVQTGCGVGEVSWVRSAGRCPDQFDLGA